MSDRHRHVEALARIVLDRLDATEPRSVRRLRLAQVDAIARLLRLGAEGTNALASETGVVVIVEECRDDYLRGLDADGGLAALRIDWEEVVLRVSLRLAQERSVAACRCSRCGAPTVEVTYRGRRRRPPGRHFRRIGMTDLYRARRCSGCGLVQPPHG